MFISGLLNAAQFRNLFLPLMLQTNRRNARANSLILEIEGNFAELFEGLITEAQFRFRIRGFEPLGVGVFVQEDAPRQATTGTNTLGPALNIFAA
jgi:hypothetical protein